MKVLTFDGSPESSEKFQLLYQGFLFGVPEGGLRGLEANRRAVRILDKFDAISEPILHPDNGKPLAYPTTGDALRMLKPEGGELQLEDIEVDMLRVHFENVPWKVSLSRAVVATHSFLSGE